MADRKPIPADVERHVLHMCGYRCANPACRQIITIDIHHMVEVSEGGGNTKDNLIALCPTCHALHHREKGGITKESIRTWHHLLLSLNEAFPRGVIDTLLALKKTGKIRMYGEGVLMCAPAIASGYVKVEESMLTVEPWTTFYMVDLNEKGRAFVDGWIAGDEKEALGATALVAEATVQAVGTVVKADTTH